MSHCIQAIITSSSVADQTCLQYPQLAYFSTPQQFAILPMTAEFIDRELEPSPGPGSDGFILLTASFTAFLLDLSVLGTLAYIETDYFGGTGSQGAAVYSNGKPLMQSEGSELADPINKALELIGVRSEGSDRFDALGLGNFRSNDAIFEAIAQAKK